MIAEKKTIFNWSRTKKVNVEIVQPLNYDELKNFINLNQKKKTISIMGGGCSYGDCYLNREGIIIDMKKFDKIIEINFNQEFAVVQAGVLIEDLLNKILKEGYYLSSVPGANNATIGGCINSNVHGKDSFKQGVFSNNVVSLKVIDSSGKIYDLDKSNENFFHALGTYGLNYLILEIKLKLKKTDTSLLNVVTRKFKNYDEMLSLFHTFENENYDMIGSWVDHFDIKGRGIFKAAKWLKNNQLNDFKKINLKVSNTKKLYIYIFYPLIKFFLVNRIFIKLCNKLLFLISKDNVKNIDFSDFYFPQQKLLPEEYKLFKKGKINIQILIPTENILQNLNLIANTCSKYKLESWWLGIKKHKKNNYMFNFAIDGFDITLQWSKKFIEKDNFSNFYDELMQIIIDNKCIIYLTQDVLLDKKNFYNMYKNQKIFIENKKKIDPNFVFRNELFNRLF
jgi:FAD/FMN-containing dehydrogenase